MRTNIKIELTDEQRNQLAILLDGKKSKRMVQRKEVVALCEQHIGGLVNAITTSDERDRTRIMIQHAEKKIADIYTPHPDDVPLMARPNDPGYVRGWNTAKRSGHKIPKPQQEKKHAIKN